MEKNSDEAVRFWNAAAYLLSRLSVQEKALCLCPSGSALPLSSLNLFILRHPFGAAPVLPEAPVNLVLVSRHLSLLDHASPFFETIQRVLLRQGLLFFDLIDASRPGVTSGLRSPSYWFKQLDDRGWSYFFWFADDLHCHCLCSPDVSQREIEDIGSGLASQDKAWEIGIENKTPMRVAFRGGFKEGAGSRQPEYGASIYVYNPGSPASAELTLTHRNSVLLHCSRPLAKVWQTAQSRDGGLQTTYKLLLPTGGTDLQLIAPVPSDQERLGSDHLSACLDRAEGIRLDFTELAPDLYLRHRQAADLLAVLFGESGISLLDVGGGNCILPQMLPGHHWEVADIVSIDHPSFLRRKWEDISGRYQAAVSVDVLEHIHPLDRPTFIKKLCALSDTLILAAPFHSPGVIHAESELNTFFSVLYPDGHRFLNEHLAYGLPEMDETARTVQRYFPYVQASPGQSINLWFKSTALFCLAEEAPGGEFLARSYAKELNLRPDEEGDCYRHFIVASRKPLPKLPAPVKKSGNAPESLITYLQTLLQLATLIRKSETWKVDSLASKLHEGAALRHHAENLQGELDRVIKAYSEVTLENQRITTALEEATKEHQRISKAFEGLSREHQRVSGAFEELSREHRRISSELERVEKEKQKHSLAYEEMRAQLDKTWEHILRRMWRRFVAGKSSGRK